jgi:DNA-binding PadR family transcriptional regulator
MNLIIKNPVTTRAAILEALYQMQEMCGFELITWVFDVTKEQVKLHEGGVYPTLRDLMNESLVVVTEEDRHGRGGRPKKLYSLTPAGRIQATSQRDAIMRLFNSC